VPHASATRTPKWVVKVYGRYKPNESERREWERIAALQDAVRAQAAGLQRAIMPVVLTGLALAAVSVRPLENLFAFVSGSLDGARG